MMSSYKVSRLRKLFPMDSVVQVDFIGSGPCNIKEGERGTVIYVDDEGTVHCLFEGSRLVGLVPGDDFFSKVAEPKGKEN